MVAKSIIVASSIAIFNLLFFLFITNYSFNKDWNKLYKLVFGSLVFRYFFSAFLIWLLLTYTELNVLIFALTFLILTFLLVFVEILFIHIKSKSVKL